MGKYTPFYEVPNSASLTNYQRHKKILRPLLLLVAFAILSLTYRHQHGHHIPSTSRPAPSSDSTLSHTLSSNSIQAIHNSTLGFGDVYVINMARRTDKLDVIRLMTSVTNISYTVVPGVDGKEMLHVAWPGFYHEERVSVTGCWRAHMNAAAAIIDNKLATGLIVEDDADWDVSLKTQLTHFALGSRHILDAPMSSEPVSPYGDGWDMLWLGHCAQDTPSKPFSRFFIANDTTTPPAGHRWGLWSPEENLTYDLEHNSSTRVVFQSAGGSCAYAYALSYTGAQKLLYHLSYSHFDSPVDSGQGDLCNRGSKGEIDFKCVGIYPGLLHGTFGEADNYDPSKPRQEREKPKGTPSAQNVGVSVRANLRNLIEGKELEGKWQGEEIGDMEMWFDEGKSE